MALQYLAKTATADEVAARVREHGHVIIDKLVPVELMDRIEAGLQPYFDATAFGHLSELGFANQRTGALIARSPSVHELILQETYLGAVKQLLSHSATVLLAPRGAPRALVIPSPLERHPQDPACTFYSPRG